jgi:hypothetical protein
LSAFQLVSSSAFQFVSISAGQQKAFSGIGMGTVIGMQGQLRISIPIPLSIAAIEF